MRSWPARSTARSASSIPSISPSTARAAPGACTSRARCSSCSPSAMRSSPSGGASSPCCPCSATASPGSPISRWSGTGPRPSSTRSTVWPATFACSPTCSAAASPSDQARPPSPHDVPGRRAHPEDQQTPDVLSGLRRPGCPADRVRARLAGALAQLAAPAPLFRQSRVPGHRAGHAGLGRSRVYARHEDYALEHTVADMIDLLDALGQEKAVWVGHDWGSPVVWSLASHHPERCFGVANLCVPYFARGFAPDILVPLVDRSVYPEAQYPVGQWDYQLFYEESFDKASAAFEANVRNTVMALFRKGNPKAKGKPSRTALVRHDGGWFGGTGQAPDLPMDTDVLTEEDAHKYAAALEANG